MRLLAKDQCSVTQPPSGHHVPPGENCRGRPQSGLSLASGSCGTSSRHHALQPEACMFTETNADELQLCSTPKTSAGAEQLCELGSLTTLLARARAVNAVNTSTKHVQSETGCPTKPRWAGSQMTTVTASSQPAHGSKPSQASQQVCCA